MNIRDLVKVLQTVTGPVIDHTETYQGIYYYHPGALTVLATADPSTSGRWYLVNPTASTRIVRVKKLRFVCQHGSALATPTAPRITLERITFTGTASGAAITPAQRKTADGAPVAKFVTTYSGMTVTNGPIVHAFLPAAALTAVGGTADAPEQLYDADMDEAIDLAAGEGVTIRQADNGTTNDTRTYVTDVVTAEI